MRNTVKQCEHCGYGFIGNGHKDCQILVLIAELERIEAYANLPESGKDRIRQIVSEARGVLNGGAR